MPESLGGGRFEGLDMFWPSPVEVHPPAGVEAFPLFATTEDAWVMDDDFVTSLDTPELYEKDADRTRGRRIMAAALSGSFPSFFAETGFIRENAGMLPPMPETVSPARVMVIGDADMFSNLLQYTDGVERNLDFLVGSADWLGNDGDIADIRGRSGGRFDRIADPEKRMRTLRLARFINTILVPLGIIAAGLVLARRRRRGGES
jgi:ABC-type uncharacterized transport system involved in gliding motility auxiliary subunit